MAHAKTGESAWFDAARATLEAAYLGHAEPWRQSGMSGPLDRWTTLRRPVAECIERSGAFLDVGCANGFLLECCLAWTAERGIAIEPHGIDLSERLIALARERLPAYAANLVVGNGLTWMPPRRYAYVRTELVYVPAALERAYVARLLSEFLEPGGRLLVANYMEGDPDPARGCLPGSHPTSDIVGRLAELGFTVLGFRDGIDPGRGRRTRVAVVGAQQRGAGPFGSAIRRPAPACRPCVA